MTTKGRFRRFLPTAVGVLIVGSALSAFVSVQGFFGRNPTAVSIAITAVTAGVMPVLARWMLVR